MPKVWNAAIIGCGRIAGMHDEPAPAGPISTHAQAYFRHPQFSLAGVVGRQEAEAEAFASKWRIAHSYTRISQLLASQSPDVISLCTPNALHYGHVMEVLGAPTVPRVLFVEKPVCGTQEELDEIARRAQTRNVDILVNHTRRFDDAHQQVAAGIRSGRFGALQKGRGLYYGGWQNNGVHMIDTLRLLLDATPAIRAVSEGAPGRENDPCLDVSLGFDHATVTVDSVDERYFQVFELDLLFRDGRVQLLDFGSRVVVEGVARNESGEAELSALPEFPARGLDATLPSALAVILDRLQGGSRHAELGVDLKGARDTMALVWRAREMLLK